MTWRNRPGSGLDATVLVLLLISPAGFAAGDECGSAATQAEMTRCFGDRAKTAAAALSSTVSGYRARLSPDQRKLFDSAQSAWESFRDLDCRFRTSGAGGSSASPMILSQCLEEHTRWRIADLRRLASCEEGDLSCPAPK